MENTLEDILELPDTRPGLTPVERKALRARAHELGPVVMVGSAALSPAVIAEINLALDHHELIKVRVLAADRDEREALFAQACDVCHAHPIQHLGRMLILYRERPAAAAPLIKPAPRVRQARRSAKSSTARKPTPKSASTRSGRR